MDRLACVDIPFLPLQLLLRREPEWQQQPAAVVESDKPQGEILFVNEVARRHGVLPGMRYAAGLSLVRELRASVMPEAEIEESIVTLTEHLRRFSPSVEPADCKLADCKLADCKLADCKLADHEPGVFWLDARGLERLFPSWLRWSRRIRQSLLDQQLRASVCVGFTRYGTYAAARAQLSGVKVFIAEDEEQEHTRSTSIKLLHLEPKVRDTLLKLGVRTVGDFLQLPPDGIRRRFGETLWQIHQLAAGSREEPLSPQTPREPLTQHINLDEGLDRVAALMLVIESLLLPLMEQLAERGEALTRLGLGFVFERSPASHEEIRTAEPTLEAGRILGLVLLRLEGLTLAEGVIEIDLEVEGIVQSYEQGEMFVERPARDRSAANRALSQLRARFGNDSVRRALLAEGHLPEAAVQWEALQQLDPPAPAEVRLPTLVRRCYLPSIRLAPRARSEPDGWMLGGPEAGSVTRLLGPYIVSGGWWAREVHREYHFAETTTGTVYWIYYDRPRRRWFLQGIVS